MVNSESVSMLGTNVVRLMVFFIAISVSFITSGFVSLILRAPNSDGISNLYFQFGFNPEENYLRVIWIILFSVLLYKTILYLSQQKPNIFRIFIAFFVAFSILSTVLMPHNKSMVGNLDTFHNGEQLSPGQAFNKDKALYKDMYVLHGAGEDVLVPSIALRLFPQNGIGSYYFLVITLQLLSIVLFVFLLSYIFKSTAIFLAVTGWFTFSSYIVFGSFYNVRDIFLWIITGLIAYILLGGDKKYKTYAYSGLGILSSLCLFFSIDRGLLVGFMALATIVFACCLEERGERFRIVRPASFNKFWPALVVFLSGLIVQILGLLILGGSQYFAYFKTYFLEIPKYSGSLFNYPFVFGPGNTFAWIPLIVASLTLLIIIVLARTDYAKRSISKKIIFVTIIFISGIFFMKAGYGRFDFGHIAYSTTLLFIAAFYSVVLFFSYLSNNKKLTENIWIPIGLVFIIFASTVRADQIIQLFSVNLRQTAKYFSLPRTSDSFWTPQKISEVSTYIKDRTSENDFVFVFTQQPIYYYLTERNNPTRFYVPWFADPTVLENEMLSSLQKNPPKIILYSSGNGWDHVDGISMKDRTPRVNTWIKENYTYKIEINGVTLLSKQALPTTAKY